MPELSLIQLTCIEMKSKWEGIDPSQRETFLTVCDSNSLIHPDLIHPTSLIIIYPHIVPHALLYPQQLTSCSSPARVSPLCSSSSSKRSPTSSSRIRVSFCCRQIRRVKNRKRRIFYNSIWDNWEERRHIIFDPKQSNQGFPNKFESSHIWPGGEFSRDALLDVDSFRHRGVFSLLGLQCVSRWHHRTGHLENNFSSSEITDNLLKTQICRTLTCLDL